MKSVGFPAEILLLFTMLIWVMYFLVYLSSPKNRVNQWCCICGFLLSIGVLKEYVVMSGWFAGMTVHIFEKAYELDDFLNSVLTAVLYYLAMPCVLVFSMYFCHLDKRYPRAFRVLRMLVFLPVLCFGAVYPWSQTREIPKTNPYAFYIVAVYNLLYGVLATVPILYTLWKERNHYQFRQRRLVSVIGLLPLWYWLITVFLFHILKLEKLYKLWQGNVFIVLFLFVYYISQLFREGIWGMRLNREYFNWSEENADLPKNVSYLIHMLKGEIAKISWCANSIRELEIPEAEKELEIIGRSVSHIEEFVRQSSQYSGEIHLHYEKVDMRGLFEEVRQEWLEKWDGKVEIRIEEEPAVLFCDYHQMKEVLFNLASNAIEAMGREGTLTLSYQKTGKNLALIRVADTGAGIPKEEISRIFEPYYTGRPNASHLGLGLSYCQKVVGKHKGYMQVKSPADGSGKGTVFTVCLPDGGGKRRR
ncbi:MAG: HAMP domain-containing sensor histidine kinase [Eubacteriales bacterium]|nr:HAMP domain-containing sensor histidine kinase [Eubacteriales bacterium]